MTHKKFSEAVQGGFRRICDHYFDDELMMEDTTAPEAWAWFWFQLQFARDDPQFFPKGKSATIQQLELLLTVEAQQGMKR